MKELSGNQYHGATIAVTKMTSATINRQKKNNPNTSFALVEVDKNNIPHGGYLLFDENGEQIEFGTYDHGKRTDKWLEHFTQDDGLNVIYRAEFKEGVLHGMFYLQTSDKTRILIDGEYAYGEKDGTWIYSNNDGSSKKVKTYDKGMLSGPYKEYTNNVLVVRGQYDENGRKTGVWKEYFNNEKLRKQYTMEEGWLQGRYEEFYKNGELKERCTYKYDGLEGEYNEYYPTGFQKIFAEYKDNQLHGAFWEFYQNGSIKDEKTYRRNGIVGGRRFFNLEGTMSTEYHEITPTKYLAYNGVGKHGLHVFGKYNGEYEENETQIARQELRKAEFGNCIRTLLLKDEVPVTAELLAQKTFSRMISI